MLKVSFVVGHPSVRHLSAIYFKQHFLKKVRDSKFSVLKEFVEETEAIQSVYVSRARIKI